MNTYRFILEKYRGISTRYTCPQCGRKHTFTRYIDTENNNQYLSERVGKCNRLDKCGYHYTPKQYFTDNPHKRDNFLVVDGSLRPFTDNPWLKDKSENVVALLQNIGKSNKATATKPTSPHLHHPWVGRVRAGKIMHYDEWSGKRLKIEKVLLKPFEQHLYFISRSLALLDS